MELPIPGRRTWIPGRPGLRRGCTEWRFAIDWPMKIAEISIVYIYAWLDLLGNGGEKKFYFFKKKNLKFWNGDIIFILLALNTNEC